MDELTIFMYLYGFPIAFLVTLGILLLIVLLMPRNARVLFAARFSRAKDKVTLVHANNPRLVSIDLVKLKEEFVKSEKGEEDKLIVGGQTKLGSNPSSQVQDVLRSKYFWSDIKKPVYFGHDDTPLIASPGIVGALSVWGKFKTYIMQLDELKEAIELDITSGKLREYGFSREREGYMKASSGLGGRIGRVMIPIVAIVIVILLIAMFAPTIMQGIRSLVPAM